MIASNNYFVQMWELIQEVIKGNDIADFANIREISCMDKNIAGRNLCGKSVRL